MVASSPLLRPVFDHTFGSWFGLSSLRSKTRPYEAGIKIEDDEHPVTIGRLRQRNRVMNTLNESEENLQWELTAMGNKGWEREVKVQGPEASGESDTAKKSPGQERSG